MKSITDHFEEIEFNPNTFKVTTLMHPSTYLNKVLLGSKQGGLQLWNIRTWCDMRLVPMLGHV